MHSDIGRGASHNYSSIRSVYYPPIATQPVGISDEVEMRIQPHADYGTFTLLFPDPIGGLQVSNGTYRIIYLRSEKVVQKLLYIVEA